MESTPWQPRICAVICEYDPFHNGHLYLLNKAREACQADAILCIMSGAVTQRGTFARYPTALRARSALACGADLVIELPARFSCGSAQEFASGGISILTRLGCISHIAFGCEAELIPYLEEISQVYREEPPAYLQLLHRYLDTGLPYPSASARALAEYLAKPDLLALLSSPNAILALQYLRYLSDAIHPLPVARIGSFHDPVLSAYASASALRLAARSGELAGIAATALPDPEPYLDAEQQGDIHEPDALSQSLLYLLRTTPPEQLAEIHGMAEGLHNRFLDCAGKAASREELLSLVKTKRFTHARLSRICTCLLLGLTDKDAAAMRTPEYAHLLGFRRSAEPVLRLLKAQTEIPLLSRARDLPEDSLQFKLDHLAQDLWALGCTNPELRTSGRDLRTPLIVL